VIEINSYPIFTEDWGADEELLLLTGISSQGFGNWKKIAEHVGTRTKEEVEKHYNSVYVDSPTWPLPAMDCQFNIDPEAFQESKRRRISEMNAMAPPPPKIAPTSAPGIHEIATFLPGRLEFEHELDNDAEDLVKDLEFGICLEYGGDQIIEDADDLDVRARLKWEEERKQQLDSGSFTRGNGPMKGVVNGAINGHHANGDIVKQESTKSEDIVMANGSQEENGGEEPTQLPPFETTDSLTFKMTLLEMYLQRVDKRVESKALMFNRGLVDYKKMQAAEKKRPREEREFVHRLRPFARLQTAEDFELFATDILYEAILRKRIQELQTYRRLGLTTAADIEKYEVDLAKRTQTKLVPARDYHSSERLQGRTIGRHSSGPDPRRSVFGDTEGRKSHERESTPRLPGTMSGPGAAPLIRRPPAPLNLANSPSLHLLTQPEQALCSQLRILPKPYLVIKETLVREYARRGGKLRRREARDLVKIDVNKTARVWDFLVQAGYLKITNDATVAPPLDSSTSGGASAVTPVNGSPHKDAHAQLSLKQPPALASSSSNRNGAFHLSSTPSSSSTTSQPPH